MDAKARAGKARRGDDLDERIREAELRVIERDERLQRELRAWGTRAAEVAAPRRWLMPAAGAMALAAVGGYWGLRLLRRGPARSAAAGAADDGAHAAPRGARAGGPADLLLRLLPMAWPLLPPGLRSRISPATASTVLGLALPILGGLVAAPPRRPPPQTVPYVDLGRYAGRWYEIARLAAPFESQCDGQPEAHYALEGGIVQVANGCPVDGRMKVSRGVATVVPESGNARLEVSLFPPWLRWLPFAWAPYWIFHVDEAADDYRVAIVGSPGRSFLWLLAREPVLPEAEVAALVSRAAQLGFDVKRLHVSQPAVWSRAPGPPMSAYEFGELFRLGVAPLELAARGTAMYWFLFLLFRFVLRRETGSIGVADILLLVLIADASQNAMDGGYTTVAEGIVLVSTIAAWNWLLDWAAYRWPAVRRFVEPPPLPLVKHGRLQPQNLKRQFITIPELMATLREQGIDKLADVEFARLEGDGKVSVIRRRGA